MRLLKRIKSGKIWLSKEIGSDNTPIIIGYFRIRGVLRVTFNDLRDGTR